MTPAPKNLTFKADEDLRLTVLRKNAYKCSKCKAVNQKEVVRSSDNHWLEVDDLIRGWATREKQTIVKTRLTITHIDFLSMTQNPDHYVALCNHCRGKQQSAYFEKVAKYPKLLSAAEFTEYLKDTDNYFLIPAAITHGKAMYQQYITLNKIYVKRKKKGYTSAYDLRILEECNHVYIKLGTMLSAIDKVYSERYEIESVSDEFWEDVIASNRLIAAKTQKRDASSDTP